MLYSYACPSGHTFELVRPIGTDTVVCLEHNVLAVRNCVNRIHVVGPTTDTRAMFRRYTEATQEWDHAVTKVEASVGHEITTSNLWPEGKARALAMQQAGEPFRPTEGT